MGGTGGVGGRGGFWLALQLAGRLALMRPGLLLLPGLKAPRSTVADVEVRPQPVFFFMGGGQ